MEVGRRSLESDNPSERRRMMRKKVENVPLAMILSFNDKDVNPNCPNSSNPYHKCGRHCISIIPTGNNLLDAVRSDGDLEWEKNSEKTGINSKCSYASNPYHKCAEYCMEKLPEIMKDAGKAQPGMKLKEEMKAISPKERGVAMDCINASNPYHVCAEYCLEGTPRRENTKGVSIRTCKSNVHLNRYASSLNNKVAEYCLEDTTKKEHLEGAAQILKEEGEIIPIAEERVNLECKTASNHHHLSTESCSKTASEKGLHEQVIRLKSTKGDRFLNNISDIKTEEAPLQTWNTRCKNASNPYHVCAEYCSQASPKKHHPEQGKLKEEKRVFTSPQRLISHCKHESNPYHICTDNCLENFVQVSPPRLTTKKSKEQQEVAALPSEGGSNPECKFASNPYHVCAEYCLQNDHQRQVMKLKSTKGLKKSVSNILATKGHPPCKFASNPYHVCSEYCSQNSLGLEQHEQATKNSKEQQEVAALPSEEGSNPECKFASNPYHVCTEYCFQNDHQSQVMKRKSMKGLNKSVSNILATKGHPQCKFASNPYHVCAEYCSQNSLGLEKHEQATKNSKEQPEVAALPSEGVSNPECKFASNPYHVCAEYCFQNDHQSQVMKLKSMKGLNKSVSNILATKGHPQCKFASNPYHVCAEYCSQNSLGLEQHEQVMKVKSSKELNNSFGKKKIATGHLQCKFASNPYHECDKYCFSQNTLDGDLKTPERKKDGSCPLIRDVSPTVQKSNKHSSEGISPNSMEVDEVMIKENRKTSSKETKIIHSIAEKDRTKDLHTEVQPLHIDTSDLFSEWAKYCSQEKATEDDESVKKERNAYGKELVKDYDDSERKPEKVGDTRTGCFLPMSLLFLIGFLLSLMCRPRVIIHSLVVSLQRRTRDFRG